MQEPTFTTGEHESFFQLKSDFINSNTGLIMYRVEMNGKTIAYEVWKMEHITGQGWQPETKQRFGKLISAEISYKNLLKITE
jgi:Glu-tRNA(Gln) amidotransferase subunit E-like FAD-binding protein